jgi:hypothetical protein
MCARVGDIVLRLAPGLQGFYLHLRTIDRNGLFPLAVKFSFASRRLPNLHELACSNSKHWSVATQSA